MYGYARVSAAGQDHSAQVEELTAAGCEKIFAEQASGKAGRKRPQLMRAMAALDAGDVLVITRLNRLARSARDALNVLAAISAKGAGFRSLREGWADTTTAHGRLMVTIMSGLAEFDREMILERTAEGRAFAKSRGVRMGRRPTLTREQAAFVVKSRAEIPPVPISQLVTLLKVSRSTICRVARAAPAELEFYPPTSAGGQVDIEELTGARPPAAT